MPKDSKQGATYIVPAVILADASVGIVFLVEALDVLAEGSGARQDLRRPVERQMVLASSERCSEDASDAEPDDSK